MVKLKVGHKTLFEVHFVFQIYFALMLLIFYTRFIWLTHLYVKTVFAMKCIKKDFKCRFLMFDAKVLWWYSTYQRSYVRIIYMSMHTHIFFLTLVTKYYRQTSFYNLTKVTCTIYINLVLFSQTHNFTDIYIYLNNLFESLRYLNECMQFFYG